MKWYQDLIYWLTIKPRLRRLQKEFPDCQIFPTGSRYVCDPPVLTTDIDFIVYNKHSEGIKLIEWAWQKSSITEYMSGGEEDKFSSYRRKKVNLIVSQDRGFVQGYIIATHICKRFNLLDKHHRVWVHAIVRDCVASEVPEHFKNNDDLTKLLNQFKSNYRQAVMRAYADCYNLRLKD